MVRYPYLSVFVCDGQLLTRYPGSTEASQKRERIIKRAAQELKDGMYVNLGIGMPLAAPAFLPEGTEIVLESENGILGMGRYPKPGEEVSLAPCLLERWIGC